MRARPALPLVCLFGLVSRPHPAAACVPSAERVLAWDLEGDLVVVGRWAERGSPPPPGGPPPTGFELRRLSTGAQVAERDCRVPAPLPCTYAASFAAAAPRAKWHERPASSPRARLRLADRRTKDGRELALEARTSAGWRWLLWVEVLDAGEVAFERHRYAFDALDAGAGQTLVSVLIRAQGGNCSYAQVRTLAIPAADLADPRRAGRQAELIARPRVDRPFEHWRTAADLGPLPPPVLFDALAAAESAARSAFAAAWWRQALEALAPAERARLTQAIKQRRDLENTRALLGL